MCESRCEDGSFRRVDQLLDGKGGGPVQLLLADDEVLELAPTEDVPAATG